MTRRGASAEARGPFFAGVLSRLRARLRELGAERRQRGKIRYWVLKPDAVPGEVIERSHLAQARRILVEV